MRTRNILLAAAGAVAVGYVLNRVMKAQQVQPVVENENTRDQEVDAYVDDSFPASDPPSWSPGGNFH